MDIVIKSIIRLLTLFIMFFSVLLSGAASANNAVGNNRSQGGWYLLAGAGPGIALYDNEYVGDKVSSLGLHFSTAVGYYTNNTFAIELGSVVSVNYYMDVPLKEFERYEDDVNVVAWNSAFYFAIRTRFPVIRPTNNLNPFLKTLVGMGNSVGFITNLDKENSDLKGLRLNQEGPVFGFSVGNMFNTESDENLWFIEFTYLAQIYRDRYIVQDDKELPVIKGKETIRDRDHLDQFIVTVGIRVL